MSNPVNKDKNRKPLSIVISLLLVIVVITSLSFYFYSKANKQIVKIRTISGPIVNPLLGWAPWATIKESNQPFTLVYADLTWRDFEPREGYYDFDTFETKQQLSRWRNEGKRIVFRFVADIPGSENHLDIPDWLFGKILGSGDFYENEYGKGFSPDYSNPILIDYHRKAIKALGERYGQDDFFAFIELGSLGHWGEWHTHSEITQLPPEDIRNLYVFQYIDAFPRTQLLLRRPFSIAQEQNLGLYNDMTADIIETSTWLDWIEHGGEYLQEVHALSPMPNGWQKAPIGGEQAPNLSDAQVYGTDLEQTIQLLKNSHTTFIGPGSPYELEYGGPLQSGLDQVMTIIGYRICIDHVQMPRWVLYGNEINITVTFSNNGIAPMYYNWPVQLYLLDEKGKILTTYQPKMDLREVLPGKFYDITFTMPIGDHDNGTYTIGLAIIDPLTGLPGVKFANENSRQDLIQVMGSFELNCEWLHIPH